MNKKILYQLDSKNNCKIWTIEVINHNSHSEVLSTSGLENGAITPHSILVYQGKSIGKSNETTHYTQAVADAQSDYNKKIKKGYVEDRSKVQSPNILGSGDRAPMLANKYIPDPENTEYKPLEKINIPGKKEKTGIKGVEAITQPKIDGLRATIKVTKNGIQKVSSRKGESYYHLEHITDEIHQSFLKIYNYVHDKYNIEEYVLDGELYTDTISFNTLNGLLKIQKKTPEELESVKSVYFRLFDVMIDIGYETRVKVLNYFKGEHTKIIFSERVILEDSILLEKHNEYTKRGNEGLMIRLLGIPYENKRTNQLLKYKHFEDDEFELVGMEEDARGGMAGAFIAKLNTPTTINGKTIDTFKVGLKNTQEECKEFWRNQSKYIGKQITVTYQNLSEYFIPRFPKLKCFRWDI
jgi:hypothetical protein